MVQSSSLIPYLCVALRHKIPLSIVTGTVDTLLPVAVTIAPQTSTATVPRYPENPWEAEEGFQQRLPSVPLKPGCTSCPLGWKPEGQPGDSEAAARKRKSPSSQLPWNALYATLYGQPQPLRSHQGFRARSKASTQTSTTYSAKRRRRQTPSEPSSRGGVAQRPGPWQWWPAPRGGHAADPQRRSGKSLREFEHVGFEGLRMAGGGGGGC